MIKRLQMYIITKYFIEISAKIENKIMRIDKIKHQM